MINVGLIGVGKMGLNHARLLSELSEFNFVGYVDPAVTISGVERFDNELDLLSKSDAIVIASPSTLHLPSAVNALRAGKDVLIEKPVVSSLAHLETLEEELNQSEGKAYVGMVERFNPAVRSAKKVLDSGILGALLQISTNREGPRPSRVKDIGVNLDLAIHDLDLAMHLAGSLFRDLHTQLAFEKSSNKRLADYFVGVGVLENQCSVIHNVNWRNPNKQRKVVLYGQHSLLEIDLLNFKVNLLEFGAGVANWEKVRNFIGESQGRSTQLEVNIEEPLKLELKAFARELEGDNSTNLCSFREAKVAMEFLV